MERMKIEKAYPPNYADIKEVLNPPETAVFAYGDIIYNPSGKKIYPDLEVHEDTHRIQQERFGNIELWWKRYLVDLEFRKDCEIEAYRNQYQFLKKYLNNKELKHALFELADNLKSLYGFNMSYQQAESKIRKL